MKLQVRNLLGLALVLCTAFFTYFYKYENPPFFFWDENFHVAAAQKYLNGVYFMEQHPPLGKLLIALGEKIFQSNPANNQFVGTDYGSTLPAGFSFKGYRFFPALLAWLAAGLFYFVLLKIFGEPLIATIGSSLYVFDNALPVHFRGAMLDGMQLFFVLLTILAFLSLTLNQKWQKIPWIWSILFGLGFGAVITTKLNGMVLVLLVPAIFISWWPNWRLFFKSMGIAFLAFSFIFLAVWSTHFALSKTIDPALPDKGYYQASAEYKAILDSGKSFSLLDLPVMLRDSFKFVPFYNRGVPQLNLCKYGENGSPPFMWPLGARSINFRWSREFDRTSYLYLQCNPAVWLCSLIGVLGSLLLVTSRFFFKEANPPKRIFLITTLLTLYISYMGAMVTISRVMYLYHYLIPLVIGMILFPLFLDEIHQLGILPFSGTAKKLAFGTIAVLIIFTHNYFAPLTYYRGLTDREVKERAWLKIWDLRCATCEPVNEMAVPFKKE